MILRSVLVAITALCVVMSVAGCEKEGPAERAGKKIDESVQRAGDDLERAGEKLDDAVREAGEKLEETGEKLQEKAER
jgi:hypothetical protein